jgi:Skp family chaperone for outer membrane proteins
MRRKLYFGTGFSIFALLAGLAQVSTAMAQAAAPTAKQAVHEELIQTLRAAHRLLLAADHDYDGHRAKAAEEVHKALKELGYHHKKPQSGSTPSHGAAGPAKAAHAGQPKIHEPQATSDAQLRQAQQLLQGTLMPLSVKHPKANANVKAAIVEINTALGIK